MPGMLILLAITIGVLLLASILALKKKARHILRLSNARTPGQEGKWLIGISLLFVLVIAITNHVKSEPEVGWISYVGLAILLIAGVIQITARKNLGQTLSLEEYLKTKQKPKGLFKKIRHPQYLALILASTGICLALSSAWAIILLVAFLIPSTWFRMSQEEQALLDKLDQDWLAYKADTKRLIPYMI